MNASDIALRKFQEGYNCSQSVLFSFTCRLQISQDLALKIANGFGAGMGRKQEICGAVSGGIMVLSLIYGRGEDDDRKQQEINYEKVRDFIEKFESEYKTVNCKKLLDGCDLQTEEGRNRFREDKMIEKCYEYVEGAVNILEEVIKEK